MSEVIELPIDVKNDLQLAFNLYKNENNKINKLKLRTILFSFVMYKGSSSEINEFIETKTLKEKEYYTFDDVCDLVKEKYDKKLEFGVGVHFGDAVIGNIGSKTRMDFTAIGDTVNTASRIEASAAGNQVLISKDVYDVLKDRVEVIHAGDRMFKNKKEAIPCYEVINVIGYEEFGKKEN